MERRIVGSIESTLNNKLRSVDARLGRLSNDFSQLSQAAKVAKESGAAAPSNSQITAATTDAKRKQLKEEFPEWAEALDELQAEMVSRIPKIDFTQQMKLEQKFSQQLEGQKLEAQRQAFLARQMARLDMEYPDWEATIVSEPYKQWLSQQPEEVKVLTNSERAVDALRVLDAYSQATSPSATNQPAGNSRLIGNRKRLESAITPTQGRAPARSSTKTEHEEFLEAFRS